jgi:hypothetical protein
MRRVGGSRALVRSVLSEDHHPWRPGRSVQDLRPICFLDGQITLVWETGKTLPWPYRPRLGSRSAAPEPLVGIRAMFLGSRWPPILRYVTLRTTVAVFVQPPLRSENALGETTR